MYCHDEQIDPIESDAIAFHDIGYIEGSEWDFLPENILEKYEPLLDGFPDVPEDDLDLDFGDQQWD